MKVRTRFGVLMLLVTLVLSGVVYGQLELAKDRSASQLQTDVNQTAVETAEQIDAEIEQSKNYVGFYASRPEAGDFDETKPYLEQFLIQPNVYAAQVIAANGTVLDFRGDVEPEVRRETIGTDLSHRTYVRRASREGEVYVTDPEQIDDTGRYIVIVSAPIFEDGEIVGVLAAALPVNELTFLATIKPLETSTQTVSVRADGETLYASKVSFSKNVTGTATVDSTGWTVRVGRDRSALDARLRGMATIQAASLALVLSLVFGLAVWQYNVNIRQAEKLLDGFSELREGNYDHTPNLSSGTEWNQLREGFADLADALAEREAELREREQRLQVFSRVLRHNLRNDVTVVVNYAELVAERSDDPTVENAAEKIAERGRGLVELGEKTNSIEAALKGKDPEPTEIDVTSVVVDVADDVREEYPDADVSVESDADAPAKAIPALKVAVRNLSENAVEHNDSDVPDVTISVKTVAEDDRWVRIAVADDGPGIPEQERAVLSEGEETDLEHGSGVGLWLVNWVVERSHGRLSFAENDPRGSVVRIDLPPGDE